MGYGKALALNPPLGCGVQFPMESAHQGPLAHAGSFWQGRHGDGRQVLPGPVLQVVSTVVMSHARCVDELGLVAIAGWWGDHAPGHGVGHRSAEVLANQVQAQIHACGAAFTLGVLGGCYVLWLGVKSLMTSWRSTRAGGADVQPEHDAQSTRVPGFWSGLWLLILNPKAFVIIAVMFAAFLHPRTSTTSDIVWISTIFTLNNLVAFALWAAFGQVLSAVISTTRQRARLDQAFGYGLIAVGCWLLIGAI